MSSVKKITLESIDGVSFEVDEAVAKHMIRDDSVGYEIPVPRSEILAKVIEYCKKHEDNGADEKELKAWDAEFVTVDQTVLLDLILAGRYFNIKGLMDLTAEAIAALIRGKTSEQIAQTFNIDEC